MGSVGSEAGKGGKPIVGLNPTGASGRLSRAHPWIVLLPREGAGLFTHQLPSFVV